jgi:iron complex transport system substrate-binding protein
MKEVHLLGQAKMPAQRIVSLAPSFTETLFFLGLDSKVVGVTKQCNYPEEVRDWEKIGSFAYPDLEKIRRLKPDLVIALDHIHSRFLDELQDYTASVLVLNPKSVEEIFGGMEEIARLAGEEEQGRALVSSLRKRVREDWQRLKSHPPLVFRLMMGESIGTPTRSSYQYDAIRLAGGNPLLLDYDRPYASISPEEVLSFDPEVIISCMRKDGEEPRRRCPGCRVEKPPCLTVVEEIETWEGWKTTSAVREGRVYPIPCEFLCRPGPRLVEGIEWMSELFQTRA